MVARAVRRGAGRPSRLHAQTSRHRQGLPATAVRLADSAGRAAAGRTRWLPCRDRYIPYDSGGRSWAVARRRRTGNSGV